MSDRTDPLTQAFFERLLKKDDLHDLLQADAERRRFRAFLITGFNISSQRCFGRGLQCRRQDVDGDSTLDVLSAEVWLKRNQQLQKPMTQKPWIEDAPLFDHFVTTQELSPLKKHLETGGSPNIYHGLTSILHAAAEAGNLQAVELLLQHGADADGVEDPQHPIPALLIATSNGHVEIVRRLLAAGADVNLQDLQGDTAILRARATDHRVIAEILLREGANPTLENAGGSSAVKGGRYYAKSDDVGDLLRSRGYPAEYRNPPPHHSDSQTSDALISQGEGIDRVREIQTCALNYDLSNKDILTQLQLWDEQFGVEILDVGGDMVRLRFLSLPNPVEPLAEKINRFCPDVVSQGFGCFLEAYGELLEDRSELPREVAELIEGVDFEEDNYGLAILVNALKKHQAITLWWD